ncbi:CoA-binding protein [Blastopirellula sp. J2-11]|uniref:CoA-binding protein n=1 Tax=Blastopirellula sp. J2-11 TaxID=2943192 RepID=UPI0021C5E228|nr:CoA-binding protein [Blastopirellula sp. J2-11]UUO07127.1 CoA-binding protein [Blastopirellula sp. J2-11]
MSKPTVAILGASNNRTKYGNKSVRAHLQQGYDVYPINPQAGEIEGLQAYAKLSDLPIDKLDRISVYLHPQVGMKLLEEIAAANATEVFFNPGAESEELLAKARELGIDPIQACSIVDVGMSPRELAD